MYVLNSRPNIDAELGLITLRLQKQELEEVFRFFNFESLKFIKGWLAIAKLKPLSLFITLLSMPKKPFDNVKIEKRKVKVVSALQYLASPLFAASTLL